MIVTPSFNDRLYKLLAAGLGASNFVECLLLVDEAQAEINRLHAETNAWKARFPQYRYRPQDDCVALDA